MKAYGVYIRCEGTWQLAVNSEGQYAIFWGIQEAVAHLNAAAGASRDEFTVRVVKL